MLSSCAFPNLHKSSNSSPKVAIIITNAFLMLHRNNFNCLDLTGFLITVSFILWSSVSPPEGIPFKTCLNLCIPKMYLFVLEFLEASLAKNKT